MTEEIVKKKFGKERKHPRTIVACTVDWDVSDFLCAVAKKLSVRRSDMCAMWLSLLDPDDEMLHEKIRNMKIEKEVAKITSTRNALIKKLSGTSFISDVASLSNNDIEKMIALVKTTKGKNKSK